MRKLVLASLIGLSVVGSARALTVNEEEYLGYAVDHAYAVRCEVVMHHQYVTIDDSRRFGNMMMIQAGAVGMPINTQFALSGIAVRRSFGIPNSEYDDARCRIAAEEVRTWATGRVRMITPGAK